MDLERQEEPLVIYESREDVHVSNNGGNSKSKGICNHVRMIAAATLLTLTSVLAIVALSSSDTDLQSMKLKAMNLVQEVVYVQGDGYNLNPNQYSALGADMLHRDNIAFCEGSYVHGVTKREAHRGCVLVSHQDLFSKVIDSKIAPYAQYCIGHDLDHLAVDFNMIKAAGVFKNLDDGYNSISQFAPGPDVEIVIFSGENFNGQTAVITSADEGRLTSKFYPDGSSANDNVKSFVIKSSAKDYFAGKDCGLNTQICPVIISKEDAIAKQPEGCALFTARDMGFDELPMKAEATGVRICANEDAYNVEVNRKALVAMKMVHDDGDKKSQISYVNEGNKVSIETYDSSEPGKGDEHKKDDLVNGKFKNGRLVNDNVYSLMLKSTAKSVPSTC